MWVWQADAGSRAQAGPDRPATGYVNIIYGRGRHGTLKKYASSDRTGLEIAATPHHQNTCTHIRTDVCTVIIFAIYSTARIMIIEKIIWQFYSRLVCFCYFLPGVPILEYCEDNYTWCYTGLNEMWKFEKKKLYCEVEFLRYIFNFDDVEKYNFYLCTHKIAVVQIKNEIE